MITRQRHEFAADMRMPSARDALLFAAMRAFARRLPLRRLFR